MLMPTFSRRSARYAITKRRLRYPRIRRSNSQPLNTTVFTSLFTHYHNNTYHEDEKSPNSQKIIRQDHVEDIEEGPVEKKSTEKKKENPEFLIMHTENVSRLSPQ
jgi:hypothetical protein